MIARFIFSACICILLLGAGSAFAQRITVARLDTSNYPEIRARIYILDGSGKPITGLGAHDFTVTENETAREITSMSCPSVDPPEAISSVLTIDVSGSMASGRAGSVPNIALARAAAAAWIEALPEGSSECAISSFDDRSTVNHDFTRDRAQLIAAIQTLTPRGGTNYNAGLTTAPAGGLAIAEGGRHKRVVVFLTDGRGTGSEEAIVAEAQRLNTTIFVVTLGMEAPEVLKRIAHRTGGEYYENVTTVEEAQGIYRAILFRAGGGEPCEIAWRSEPACNPSRAVTIALPSRSLTAKEYYTAPKSSVPMIELSPSAAAFGVVKPGETREIEITLSAANRPITIEKIESPTRASAFTMSGLTTPVTLNPGERRTVKVRFTASDTTYTFARWNITSNACAGTSIMASAGRGGGSTIRVVHPNGGERFQAGTETTIRWDGVLAEDTVRIDYSTDNGATWRTVASRASGLSHRWKVPATPSDRCLARVAQLEKRKSEEKNAMKLSSHIDWVLASNFNHDGTRIVTASWDGTAKVWDARSGKLLHTLVMSTGRNGGRPSRVFWAEFSRDGDRVITACDNRSVQVWDAASGRQLRAFQGRLFQKPDADEARMDGEVTQDPIVSSDGSRILLQSNDPDKPVSSGATLPTVWDVASGRRLFAIEGHEAWVNGATFSPDGKLIVTSSNDSTARIWDAFTGRELRRFTDHTERVTTATFSPDGKWVATASSDQTVRIWNVSTGDTLQVFRIPEVHGGTYIRPLFSPDGQSILIWAGVDIAPTLYDVASGDVIHTLQEGTGRSSVGLAMFSPDGAHIAVREALIDIWDVASGKKVNEFKWDMQMSHMAFSPDGARLSAALTHDVNIWDVDAMPEQEDRSDATWSIIDSRPASVDVDFGRRIVGMTHDSVVSAFIVNNGSAPLRVDAITIEGKNAKEFSLVSGIPPFEVAPGSSHPVEFRFAPGSSGARSATAKVDAGGRILSQDLRGEGVWQTLRLEMAAIDFGAMPVGEVRDTIVEGVLKNVGRTKLDITGAALTGPDTSQFVLVSGTEGFSLPPGSSHKVALRFTPTRGGRTSTTLAFRHTGAGSPARAEVYGRGLAPDDEGPEVVYSDPTTFRTIAVPNAIVPPSGTAVAGVYDVIGLMGGYVPVDHVMILAGGAVPSPQDWGGVKGSMYAAYSLGLKVGMPVNDRLNVAAGFQWARSIYDQDITPDSLESSITVSTPYAAVSYGTDDARVSATFGYAFKRHTAVEVGEFTKDAMIIGIGADYRFARRWKVALEAVSMESLGYVPIALTARFFGEEYAIDAGLGYLGITTGDASAPSIPVAPVVSYVRRF